MAVLYAGDGSRNGAAGYLIAVMQESGVKYTHVPPSRLYQMPSDPKKLAEFEAVILSDAPAKKLGNRRMQALKEYVLDGGGLGMLGGWDSFGAGGYSGTPVENVLPVRCIAQDDRVNNPNGFKMIKETDHPILEGLPWYAAPTGCGYNLIEAVQRSDIILTLREIMPSGNARIEDVHLSGYLHPLLVVQDKLKGRTLALATDPAPHWAGCLVDWGSRRFDDKVGEHYVRFFDQMLAWLAKA